MDILLMSMDISKMSMDISKMSMDISKMSMDFSKMSLRACQQAPFLRIPFQPQNCNLIVFQPPFSRPAWH
jgi:hypothetical protein